MKQQKIIKISLTIVIILIAGIFYSCREKDNQKTILSLQNQDSNTTTSSGSNQSDKDVLDSQTVADADSNGKSQSDVTNMNGSMANQESNEKNTETIYVHLCGAVKNPDVYQVSADSRLIDLISLAGGLMEDAAGDFVNQASKVSDGQQIYIPTKDEVEGKIPTTTVLDSNDSNKSNNDNNTDKVNINTATKDELMTLSGIGESKADSIIAYREEHNGFKEIEDIKNINGIKDSVFNKVCDKITIN
jgi:competence protein ComEA